MRQQPTGDGKTSPWRLLIRWANKEFC